jgi:hypothetical protein
MKLGRDLAVFIAFVLYSIFGEIVVGINLVSQMELITLVGFLILAEVSIGAYYDKKEEAELQ